LGWGPRWHGKHGMAGPDPPAMPCFWQYFCPWIINCFVCFLGNLWATSLADLSTNDCWLCGLPQKLFMS
jgi:hypothetical protein